jgi:hypothetical protein
MNFRISPIFGIVCIRPENVVELKTSPDNLKENRMTCGLPLAAFGDLEQKTAVEHNRRLQEHLANEAKKKEVGNHSQKLHTNPYDPANKRINSFRDVQPAQKKKEDDTVFPTVVDVATTFALGEMFNQVFSPSSDTSYSGDGGSFDGGGASGDY